MKYVMGKLVCKVVFVIDPALGFTCKAIKSYVKILCKLDGRKDPKKIIFYSSKFM